MAEDTTERPVSSTVSLRVLGQYVRDLSFENPRPGPVKSQPNIDLGIDVNVMTRDTATGVHEVSLKMTAKASADEATLFICELDYAGIFQIQGLSAPETEEVLLVECPRLLFPFARRVIADLTRDGGLPPLLVDPVDFHALYRRQKEQGSNDQGPTSA